MQLDSKLDNPNLVHQSFALLQAQRLTHAGTRCSLDAWGGWDKRTRRVVFGDDYWVIEDSRRRKLNRGSRKVYYFNNKCTLELAN